MSKNKLKKAGLIFLFLFLLLGILAVVLYLNRKKFYPKVEEVTYLRIELKKDTADVEAGVVVNNRAPFPFRIDSVNYNIRNNGARLGWGSQTVGQRLPSFSEKELDFNLFLDTDLYRKHLKNQKGKDSLELDVLMKVYIDPPLFEQKVITIDRSIKTAVPKAPAIQIDSFLVKSFSPEAGYSFQLNLNAGNTNLPNLGIENFSYEIRLTDSILIKGEIDSTFRINKGEKIIEVPIHLETAEMIELLQLKLGKQKILPYHVKASAIIKTDHRLFEHTDVSVEKAGTLDTRKIGSSSVARPSVKEVQSLKLVSKNKTAYLQADLLIHNPTKLPLYIDSARYSVRYKGKVLAFGGKDYEKVLPAKGNQSLQLELAVDKEQYKKIMDRPKEEGEIPLDVELMLHYNLKGSKPQQIKVKKRLTVPVMKKPSFKVLDIRVEKLDPKVGAKLMVKFEIENYEKNRLSIDELNYHLLLRNETEVTGQTSEPIIIDSGITVVEIPVDLSKEDINQLTKRLLQGVETWDYKFTGTATVTLRNSLLQQTEIALQTSGVYEIQSKGTPDYMPEISKIDTLQVNINYDTAWVNMYAAIYYTLPVPIHVTQLQVDVLHENDTIGKTVEILDMELLPDTNTFDWHTLGVNYGKWEEHLKHHQGQDSILLNLPTILTFELSELGAQQVEMDWSTEIPTPATPVTLLQKTKLSGVGFRAGLKFNALVIVQNANAEGLEVKNIDYQVDLENGVSFCGKINRTYKIPVGRSEIEIPINLSLWEALKMFTRQVFGPPEIHYTIRATAQARTNNPKLQDVYIVFVNKNKSNIQEKKKLGPPPAVN